MGLKGMRLVGVDWIHDRDQWWALVNMEMRFGFIKRQNFLTNCVIIN
jgi:hypothetical protein